VGFRVAEEAARACGARLDQERWGAVYGVGRAGGEPLAVLLPQTFMNLSGEPVGQAARFWKVDPRSIVVAHDELDLDLGRLQVKVGGGDGGHNGLKSLRQHLGTGDYLRVRVGVSRPPPQWDPADYVLSKFLPAEEDELKDLVPEAALAAITAATEGAAKAMNRFNKRPGAKQQKAPAGRKGAAAKDERRKTKDEHEEQVHAASKK
jgi:PTH1 family peptidyl-tRNA hydrolase